MDAVLIAVASCKQELVEPFLKKAQALAPELPLYVVSEFPPPFGHWIPYRFERSFEDQLDRCLADLGGRRVHLCCVIQRPDLPLWQMRWLAFRLAPLRGVYFNENLDHFMLRPSSIPTIARHFAWRIRSWFTFQFNPGGRIYTHLWRLRHPSNLERPLLYRKCRNKRPAELATPVARVVESLPRGISVVIPSRNGRELLSRSLPLVLAERPDQVIVVDNGSDDGTAAKLPPGVECVVSASPMSFAAAVNAGIARARFSHVCLLNNDMEIEPGFFAALHQAFDRVPDLFSATAQIFFPPGVRREETGKAVLPVERDPFEFPLRCDLPVEGENHSPVLYGSGGCSLYDTAKLRALGGFDESFTPAYVEDLDVGFRAWRHGWPTVFCADARVLHHHRSTTGRYFSPDEIALAIEKNWLRFAAKNGLYDLWRETIERINRKQNLEALRFAATLTPSTGAPSLAFGAGDIAVFEGRQQGSRPCVLIASCYAPYPLSHGGAVRMFNLMRRAARDFDQVLIYFADDLAPPPEELREICREVVVVRRHHSHRHPRLDLPDVVQQFTSGAFDVALGMASRKHSPFLRQLEFTQLAQYRAASAPSILVEHDVTIDLYEQLAANASGGERWELDRQLALWRNFETTAWRDCDRVVVMSERDRATVGDKAILIPNGVDTERYRVASREPEAGRLLFIGSFAHLPNLMAVAFFVEQVLPTLAGVKLHIIAGARPDYYLNFYRDRVSTNLNHPAIELEAFVADVRPAYERAEIVIAPLLASAGTNIKVLEAMAMGKPVVATSAGVHGLDVEDGLNVAIANSAADMARQIRELLRDRTARERLGHQARRCVEDRYDWDRIAEQQAGLYRGFLAEIE